MHRAGVAVQLAEIGAHLLEDSFIDLGGGVIVEIDLFHAVTSSTTISSATRSRSLSFDHAGGVAGRSAAGAGLAEGYLHLGAIDVDQFQITAVRP